MSSSSEPNSSFLEFLITCVKNHDQTTANEYIEKTCNTITFHKAFTPRQKNYLIQFYKLLTSENKQLLKKAFKERSETSVDFSESYQSIGVQAEKATNTTTEASNISEVNIDTTEASERRTLSDDDDNEDLFALPIAPTRPQYPFCKLWILDRIRAQHFFEDISDLPASIFAQVQEIPPEKSFEVDFDMTSSSFVQKTDIETYVYLPLFSNTPLLVPQKEFKSTKFNLPLIFRHYFKDDLRVGNLILIECPTEQQMTTDVTVFGSFKFSFLGVMGKDSPYGVYLNVQNSLNFHTFAQDFPGVEDKQSLLNDITYFSNFQVCQVLELTDSSQLPDPTILDSIPNQLCYTGIISYNLAELYWAKLERDKRGVHSVPNVMRMNYRGYLGDYLISRKVESTVSVHRQMRTSSGDLGVIMYDRSNSIPFGMISFNVVAMLLHYGVPPETLLLPVPTYVIEKELGVVSLRDQVSYLYSIIDKNDPYAKAIQEHINLTYLIRHRHIPLRPSYRLVGVIDPFAVLQAGEVALGLERSAFALFGKTVLVASNTTVTPLALQRFQVKNEKLAGVDFTGCVVFNAVDGFYYMNTEFDSVNFNYRKSDFIVISEKDKDTHNKLMELDITPVVQSMKGDESFGALVSKIVNQTDALREKAVNYQLLRALVTKSRGDLDDFSYVLFNLIHTDERIKVKEELFRVPKVPHAPNFFGIQLEPMTPYFRFEELFNGFVEDEARKIEAFYKKDIREKSALKVLMSQAEMCSDEDLENARKQWFHYSVQLKKILDGEQNWLLQFVCGAALKKGGIERSIESLRRRYRMYNGAPDVRKKVALARYRVVYTEKISQEKAYLSPSFAFLMAETLFLKEQDTFAFSSRGGLLKQ